MVHYYSHVATKHTTYHTALTLVHRIFYIHKRCFITVRFSKDYHLFSCVLTHNRQIKGSDWLITWYYVLARTKLVLCYEQKMTSNWDNL